jgi:hypothetical protein
MHTPNYFPANAVAETETPNIEGAFSEASRALVHLLEDLQEGEHWGVAAVVCKLLDGLNDAINLYEERA